MSRIDPPAPVVRLAMVAAVPPVALLSWIVAGLVASQVGPVALTVTAAVAGWGARTGVLATDRRGGVLRRAAARLGRGAGIVAAGGVVGWVSPDVVPDDWPGVALRLSVPVVLLLAAFLVARGIGRAYRRQADPLASGSVHREADAALPAMLLTGAAVAVAAHTVAVVTGGAGWASRPWVPIIWVAVCVVAIAAVRPATLRARAAISDGPSGWSWVRALAPPAVTAVALALLITWILGTGVGLRLRVDLPDLTWLGDLVPQRDPRPAAPVEGERSFAGAAWLLPILAGAALALMLLRTRPARRRPVRPQGQKMPLSELLRSLLSALFESSQVDDADVEPTDPTSPADEVALGGQLAEWIRRLRPRPRDPAAAILFDYAAVQRHLPARRRRRDAETVLVHAARERDDALDELAALVCAIRYAGLRPTASHAERSRTLARRVMRR